MTVGGHIKHNSDMSCIHPSSPNKDKSFNYSIDDFKKIKRKNINYFNYCFLF